MYAKSEQIQQTMLLNPESELIYQNFVCYFVWCETCSHTMRKTQTEGLEVNNWT
jgi:hypothetical protein